MALMLRTCLSIFFILSASFFVPNLLAFDLAKNGKASATVVIHGDAGISVKHNAKIFVKYLSTITGADFEISDGVVPASGNVILLGAPYPSKRFEEISIRLTQPNLLVVTGEGTRGPVYAMYRLLEYFGCYFWAPGNETVPSKKDLSLPQNFKLVDAPVFQFRQPLGASTYSRDWRSKNYINGDMNMLHSESTPEMGGPYEMAMSRQWLYGIPCDDKAKYAMESNPEWFAWRSGAKARTHLGLCFTNTKLLDTRKTTPNMRIFEKYAVKVGGGYNHRYNLSDGILLKDNHIGAAGGVKEAVRMAKEYAPFVRKIEIEVENLDMLKEAGIPIVGFDTEVADIIKLIFNLYEQGNGVTKIAQILNDKGILTPTKYKMSKGINFKNQGKNIEYWCESTVSKILKNEVYIGNMVQGYNKKLSYKSKKMKNQPMLIKTTMAPS